MKQRSRELRQNASPIEANLWDHLRDRRLGGFKFRRQHVIGPYIADFYCAEANLVVELEGNSHEDKQRYDAERQAWIERQGIKVMRLKNDDVYDSFEGALELVLHVCEERSGRAARRRPLTPALSPEGRGRTVTDTAAAGTGSQESHKPSPSPPSAGERVRVRGSQRAGITLVEMLVVVALTVLLMSIVAEVFALASETMSRLRALSTVNEKIRSVERLLRLDLENRSVRNVQPPVERKAGADGIFGTLDDWIMPVGIDPRDNLGYFMIVENSPADEQGDDTDDILQLTCRVANAGRPDLAVVGIGYEGNVVVGSEPDMVDGVADGRARSLEAEVIWFLRKGTLYRRVLLVGLPQPSSLPAGQSWYYNYDISARPPLTTGTVPIVNTLGDLSYRSTRFGHQLPSNYTSTIAATPPLLPGLAHDYPGDVLFRSNGYAPGLLEFEDSQTSGNPGFGYHSAATGTDQLDHNFNYPFAPGLSPLSLPERWFGRPTLRETSSANWNYPNDAASLVWNSTGGFTDSSSTLYYQTLNNTALRPAEDAVLSNVLSVDVKVWDPDGYINEDTDGDGNADPGEDLNGNGTVELVSTGQFVDLGKMCLDPGNSATAMPSYLAPGPNPSSGTTYGLPGADPNANSGYVGFASTYPKPGGWPPERPLLAWLSEAGVPAPGIGGYRRGFGMPFGMLDANGSYNSSGYAIPAGAPGLPLGMFQSPQPLWRTYDTWCSAYTKPTQAGITPVAPSYIVPLRGLQIKIRFVDPESRLTREITIVQELQ